MSCKSVRNKNFQLTVHLYDDGIIGLRASDEKLLLALGLKRQSKSLYLSDLEPIN